MRRALPTRIHDIPRTDVGSIDPGRRGSPRRAAIGLAGRLAVAALAGLSPAHAEIYKCVDLDGHVSYGSAPCESLDLLDRLIDDNGVRDAEPPAGSALPDATAPPSYAPPTESMRDRGRGSRRNYSGADS